MLACLNFGITLITIPFFWKKTKKELIEMIENQRPELITIMKIE